MADKQARVNRRFHLTPNGLKLVINSFRKARCMRRAPSVDELSLPDCVIGASFGFRKDTQNNIRPGQANKDLASFIATHYPAKVLLLQHEIATALSEDFGLPATLAVTSNDSTYLDTRKVLLKAKDYMLKHDLQLAVIVAHAYHAPRVSALCVQLGISAIIPGGLPASWDKQSEQWWTRSQKLWNSREPGVILHHAVKRWI